MIEQSDKTGTGMTGKKKLGWQLSGLLAGMTVSMALVFACFGLAIYFSEEIAQNSGKDRVMAVR